MAEAEGVDKSRMKQYLVPALGVAAVVVLVGLVISVSSGSSRKMSDGSNGSSDDSDLKEAAPGVKYRDLKDGIGEPCPAGAKVTVHYTGWLDNGDVFDSSKDRGQPFQATLKAGGGLIAGWVEGIPGMKKGGIRKLVIAPEKAYGERGAPPKIPGGSTLIFEVELVEFTPPPPPPPPAPTKLSDGTEPGAADPGLKDIGGGLKIRDIKEGSGEPVKEGATVTIHYTGWLLNGTSFDSSRPRGEPTTFPLPNLIQGWQKGIPGDEAGRDSQADRAARTWLRLTGQRQHPPQQHTHLRGGTHQVSVRKQSVY